MLAQNEVKLFANYSENDNGVRLYWDCHGWQENMKGYVIMRAEPGTDNWVLLNKKPIIPAVEENPDFTSRGLVDIGMIENVNNDFKKRLDSGLIGLIDPKEMHSLLTENNGLKSGDRIALKSDFSLALIVGFAYFDNSASLLSEYDYAIYAHYVNGEISSKPLDMFSLRIKKALEFDVDFSIAEETVSLQWGVNDQEIKSRSIIGFLISRSDTLSEDEFKQLSDYPIGYIREVEGSFVHIFPDRTADPEKDYIYKLTPMDLFQQTHDPVIVEYIADHYKELSKAEINKVKLYNDSDMELTWTVKDEEESLIDYFNIIVSETPSHDNGKVIGDKVLPDIRQFKDTTRKIYGKMYFYHVQTVGKYGQMSYSDPDGFYYMGLSKPKTIEHLHAELDFINDTPFVKLNWDPTLEDDSITKGYLIYSDELIPDTFLQLSGLPVLKQSEYLYPVTTDGGRDFKFRVAGVSTEGHSGNYAETQLYVGALRLPRVLDLRSELLKDGSILLKWSYPEMQDIQGFRLFMNSEELAGPEDIRPDMRSYVVVNPKIENTGTISFNLQVVGSLIESEIGLRREMRIPIQIRPSEIPPPISLEWEWTDTTKRKYIQLCWEPPYNSKNDIQGYVISSDYHTEGQVRPMLSLPMVQGTEFIYENHAKDHRTITIRVAPVTVDGETGRYAEVTIPINSSKK